MYAKGKKFGVVLNFGDEVCHASHFFEGFQINNAIQRIDIGGKNTKHLLLLLRKGYFFVQLLNLKL